MSIVTTLAIDLAKNTFQVAGADASGIVAFNRKLSRGKLLAFFVGQPPSVVGMEACGSAHHWARELLALGHQVRLLPPQYVKPFVRRNKTDARDAEAILEAMVRPACRTVPVKTVAQQCARALHRTRDLMVRDRTRCANALRAQLYEVGIIAAQGDRGHASLRALVAARDERLPPPLLPALDPLVARWGELDAAIRTLDAQLLAAARADEAARRLMTVPNIGPLTAHAMVAAVGDGHQFRSARDFAAWVGLTPSERSSAGKRRPGGISRAGDGGLRRLFVLGASSGLRHARARPEAAGPWITGLLARRPVKVAVVAQAARTARIAWAVLTSEQPYRDPGTAAA